MAGGGAANRADEVLRHFFRAQQSGVAGRRVDRLRRAEADLRACLEDRASLLLTEQELALLALERQFDPEGAAARVAAAETVLLMLPLFLEEPRWHGADVEDRRLRIRLAEPLAHELVLASDSRRAELSRAVWIVEATVQHAAWMLRTEREWARPRSRR